MIISARTVYTPPPFFWPKGIFGGVYFEAPRGRNFIPPPLYIHPPRPEGYFQGGGWGCTKLGPVTVATVKISRPHKEPQSQKIARTAPKNFLNDSRALPNKNKGLRQIAPESSPESSAKSLSHKFLGVPFLSLKIAVRTKICLTTSAA